MYVSKPHMFGIPVLRINRGNIFCENITNNFNYVKEILIKPAKTAVFAFLFLFAF